MGVMRGYQCERCRLAFVIGGYFYWSLDCRCEQAVCTACGTMHRLNEDRGVCTVTALPCPVRRLRRVTGLTSAGQEYHAYEWPFIEEEWEFVGEHPGGIEALGELECSNCGAVGRMQSLELPPHPDGCWPSFREVCPLCGGPMPCVYDATVN